MRAVGTGEFCIFEPEDWISTLFDLTSESSLNGPILDLTTSRIPEVGWIHGGNTPKILRL